MAPRPSTQTHAALTRIFALALLLPAAVPACSAPEPRYDWHGSQRTLAAFDQGALHAELPAEVPVHAVVAAAEMTLSRRGYTITASESTDDSGRVVARPADPKLMRKVTVTSRLTQTGTALTIRTNPGGNEHVSRDILERMLTRLGL
jgi:hypothetical protein